MIYATVNNASFVRNSFPSYRALDTQKLVMVDLPRELLATPSDALEFQQVLAFCKKQRRENKRLEYKREFGPKPGLQVAKEAAAFANTEGGTILWGVEEQEKTGKPKPNQCGTNLGNDPRQTVINACFGEVFPPIEPTVSDFLPNPEDNNKGFLVVRIPASRDVHTVEERRGIYVRTGDHCKPINKPTDEQIAGMFARREVAVSRQAERRANNQKKLNAAIRERSEWPNIWISIGPYLDVGRIGEPRALRDSFDKICVAPYYANSSVPFKGHDKIRALQNGIYAVSRRAYDGFNSGLIDCFGNVCLQFVTEGFAKSVEFDNRDAESRAPKSTDGTQMSADAGAIVAYLMTAVEVAKNLYAISGFVGMCSISVRIEGTQHVPLIIPRRNSAFTPVLGTCPLSRDIVIEDNVSTEVRYNRKLWMVTG